MIKFVGQREKAYNCLIEDGSEDKKIKMHKKKCHRKKT